MLEPAAPARKIGLPAEPAHHAQPRLEAARVCMAAGGPRVQESTEALAQFLIAGSFGG